MTGEQTTSDNQEPFQNGQLIQFPEKEHIIPLAVSYSAEGTPVVWEAHPYTRTDVYASAEGRKAIIFTDDNQFYLKGDTLYDVGRSQAINAIESVQLSQRTLMPDLVIGDTALFSGGSRVRGVLIATGEATIDTYTPDQLNDRTRQPVNPFDIMNTIISRLSETQLPRLTRENKKIDWGSITPELPAYSQTFRYRDRRFSDVSDATRSDSRPLEGEGPPIKLGVTNLAQEEAQRDDEVPLQTSRHDVPISPRMAAKDRELYRYKPRRFEVADLAIRATLHRQKEALKKSVKKKSRS